MNLKKAIKILSETVKLPENFPPTQYIDAVKLGTEAMKRFDNARLLGMDYPLNLLPGEDKP